MDIIQIPAVAIFTGMLTSFAVILLIITVGDVIKH
jgi:hypothetical protein